MTTCLVPTSSSLLRIFLLLMMFVASAAGAQAPPVSSPNGATTEGLTLFRVTSLGQLEMEVWVSGRRVGFTPVEILLPKGRYRMTASADSIIPFIGTVGSPGSGEYDYVIPAAPLTVDNYQQVSLDVMKVLAKEADNLHMIIIALHMITSAQDGRELLARADRMKPGDPVVDLLRAKVCLKESNPVAAREAVDRAMVTLGSVALAWRVRSEVLEAQGDLDAALKSANQAMLLDPEGWRSLRIRSRINRALGNERAATADEERAEELYRALHQMIERAAADQKRTKSAAAGVATP